LEERIEEDKEAKKMDHGQLRKWRKTSKSDLEHLAKNKEIQVGEALKMWVKWT
jgi:hypothetical protein